MKETELYACESRACPSYQYKEGLRVVDKPSLTEHEVYFLTDDDAEYKVYVCHFCGLRAREEAEG